MRSRSEDGKELVDKLSTSGDNKKAPRGHHVAHEKSHVTYTLTRGAKNKVVEEGSQHIAGIPSSRLFDIKSNKSVCECQEEVMQP